MDADRLVFIDETWATTNMTRLRGRCQRGKRLVAAVPHGHWRTSTFIAALRIEGLTAPLVLDGAMNGDVFRAYVEQILAPTLAPGDIVIMDMCGRPSGSKKNRQVRCGASSGADMCTASGAAA
jgi:DDE superfamily endonuclease